MKKSRVYICALTITLFICFVIYKLADIQLLSTESYGPEQVNLLEESVKQRSSEISLSNGRGVFLDRANKRLNNESKKDIVLFPFVHSLDLPESLRAKLDILIPDWRTHIEREKKPVYLSDIISTDVSTSLYEEAKQANITGIVAVERTIFLDPLIASHTLGIVRENSEEYKSRYEASGNGADSTPIGISGLEKTFDSFLVSTSDETLKYHVDARGNPLLGLNLRYQGTGDYFYPVKVQTTIDSDIQYMTEQVIDQHQITKGGLVLLDIETRDVLAMVSRPKIDESNPYSDNTLQNQMLTAEFPGSIFKTVVAAAAIEQSPLSLERTYDCDNNLYGDDTAARTLGILNFQESFALSCNFAFGEIAKVLMHADKEILEKYADKMGLLEPVGWSGDLYHFEQFSQFPEEEQGTIWGNNEDKFVERAILQTAIGQKEVKITPLAIANMMATIANNGVKGQVRIAKKILYNNGTTMMEFKPMIKQENLINKETALQLKRMLIDVVENGTGQSLKGARVAGKSGTAETGRNGENHYWFAGFFPSEKPKYALVVVDLDQISGESKNYQVFQEIATNLEKNK
ncbi:peptidoglycan D,D-transpeptidase FtsI family protein [Aquibacillus saliphilus]|uniref:peptidoglycan D,D-transpeptidase FtsI family protein n=1 Tax=Aquibacillus saliphilus TaxID=1909422 RepID=UPI001CF05BD2|nr:penicillin-binding protein 2 [Aquibacillus saliphilus]